MPNKKITPEQSAGENAKHAPAKTQMANADVKRLPPIKQKLAHIQQRLLGWYANNARNFIWRGEASSPYMTLVSEIMLQQTQTQRVQTRLPEFLEQFPDIFALADADNATMIRAWTGMGYNNRALRLRDCARAIVKQHGGVIPSDHEVLLALPGIGPYTAAALCAFAFHQDIAVLDVNIRRVYSRVFWRMQRSDQTADPKLCERLADRVFPAGKAAEWHQALMDLGATICIAYKPRCERCVLATLCASAGKMTSARPERKREPSFRGQPNRIWRGKIVEILRTSTEGRWRDAMTVLQETQQQGLWNDEDVSATREWLNKLLLALDRDGIVEIRPRQTGRVGAPANELEIRLRR